MATDWRDALTTGDRLRWVATEFQPPQGRQRGVALLVDRLRKRGGVQGATRQTVDTYLANKPEAPLAFLRAVASELGVSPEWLAFGTDAPTPEFARIAGIDAHQVQSFGGSNPYHDGRSWEPGNELRNSVLMALGLEPVPLVWLDEHRRTVREGDPSGSLQPAEPVPAWVTAIGMAWVRFVRSSSGRLDDIRELPQRLAEAIAFPVRAMGVDAGELQRRGYLTEYILAMLPALLRLADVQRMTRDAAPVELEAPIPKPNAPRPVGRKPRKPRKAPARRKK